MSQAMDTPAPPSHAKIVDIMKLLKQTTDITVKKLAEGYGETACTIYNWLAAPDEPKLEMGGRKRGLTPEEDLEVAEWMLKDPECKQKDAVVFVKEQFGVDYCQESISNLLKRAKLPPGHTKEIRAGWAAKAGPKKIDKYFVYNAMRFLHGESKAAIYYSNSFGVVSASNCTTPWRLFQTSYGNVNMRETLHLSMLKCVTTGTLLPVHPIPAVKGRRLHVMLLLASIHEMVCLVVKEMPHFAFNIAAQSVCLQEQSATIHTHTSSSKSDGTFQYLPCFNCGPKIPYPLPSVAMGTLCCWWKKWQLAISIHHRWASLSGSLTAAQLSQEFQVTTQSIYNWIKAPTVPPPEETCGCPPTIKPPCRKEIFDWLLSDPTRSQEDAARHFLELWGIKLSQQFDFNAVRPESTKTNIIVNNV
ncbi:hypothetical protein M427DRAFT_46704 [Gonapodya prolifera JEL478]|uniref:Uncharacterized protein n=1 Tax=Gonapodya prolifera (strain JEL478) TaxID=1344416 RepID=A0A139A520_GONPJ|nr:hypothetical protein M427DRAFT_46704 [Gonapodya prolifera JEL478]|eukprot:KXS11896.1 hypothetical protein M427DRAFT_46704 [Gonapodya prolifera JEL478]